jgi:hypothetical protein
VNVPKTHDNGRVKRFLDGYLSPSDLCGDYPQVDDIFSGALALRTAGDTSTRSLSRRAVFAILQQCDTIDTASVDRVTKGHYSYQSVAGYAARARVLSKAIEGFIAGLSALDIDDSTKALRQAIDEPYNVELRQLGLLSDSIF